MHECILYIIYMCTYTDIQTYIKEIFHNVKVALSLGVMDDFKISFLLRHSKHIIKCVQGITIHFLNTRTLCRHHPERDIQHVEQPTRLQ